MFLKLTPTMIAALVSAAIEFDQHPLGAICVAAVVIACGVACSLAARKPRK